LTCGQPVEFEVKLKQCPLERKAKTVIWSGVGGGRRRKKGKERNGMGSDSMERKSKRR
jgi:hypothetical protein